MALNNMGLGFIFSAKDRASATIAGINRNMVGLMGTSTKAGIGTAGALIGVAAAAGTAAVGVAGISKAIDLANIAGSFEKELAAVGAISQATAADMKVLTDTARQAGIATQFSPQEAAQGLRSLAVQGFNAAESSTALTGALDLAAGGSIPVADAAMAMASSLRVFSLEADQSTFAADKLLRITNRTALQANEMSLAIGNLGRGVGLTKQSIDEMLPSIGLVRNSGVAASVAASSVSSALQFMAKNAKKFTELGVSVTDAAGNFRPFMDIVLETQTALADQLPNAADRTKKALELFGRFGITAFSAISTQTEKGIRDTAGNLLKGADAVNFLRGAMQNAGGASAEFKEALLNTYEGQKVLLSGSVQTLAIEAGRAFATLFKPVVTVVIRMVNLLIAAWSSLPGPVRLAISAAFLFGSAMLFVVGAATGVALVLMLLSPFLAAIGAVALYAAGAMAALGVVFAAVALAGIGLWYAIKNNIGGLGDFFEEVKFKVQAAWGAIQVILAGKNLDPVTQTLLRKLGILGFVQSVASVVMQVKAFWGGMVAGFKAGLVALAPVWVALKNAIAEVGEVLGLGTQAMAEAGGGAASMAAKGAMLGRIVARLVGIMAEGVTWALMIGSAFAKAGLWISDVFGDAVLGVTWLLENLWPLLKNVGAALMWITTLGQADVEFGGFTSLVDKVKAHDESLARSRANIGRIGVGAGGFGAPPQAFPAEASAGIAVVGGIGAMSPDQMTAATAAGVARGLSSTPIELKGDVEGGTLFTLLQNIDRNTQNRRGLPVPPGFKER